MTSYLINQEDFQLDEVSAVGRSQSVSKGYLNEAILALSTWKRNVKLVRNALCSHTFHDTKSKGRIRSVSKFICHANNNFHRRQRERERVDKGSNKCVIIFIMFEKISCAFSARFPLTSFICLINILRAVRDVYDGVNAGRWIEFLSIILRWCRAIWFSLIINCIVAC